MKKIGKIILGIVILQFVIGFIIGIFNSNNSKNRTENVYIGEIAENKYFKTTVKKVMIKNTVNTGNRFVDLKDQIGSSYVILDLTIENIDSESRMVTNMTLHVQMDGRDIKFDAESIHLDGFFNSLNTINPYEQLNGLLIFKIPDKVINEGVNWELEPSKNGEYDPKISLKKRSD